MSSGAGLQRATLRHRQALKRQRESNARLAVSLGFGQPINVSFDGEIWRCSLESVQFGRHVSFLLRGERLPQLALATNGKTDAFFPLTDDDPAPCAAKGAAATARLTTILCQPGARVAPFAHPLHDAADDGA